VPEWQRSYAWESPQIESFWLDLLAFDQQYPDENIVGEEYFLGSIVLVVGGNTNLLLDGQQRLATATILLSALRGALSAHKADAATRLQNKYIADFDDQTNTTTHVLTLNRYDQDFFQQEIQLHPAPSARPKPTLRSHGRIRKAREYFDARISETAAELGAGEPAFHWNLRISRVLCNHMSVVAVTSSDEDNAAAVFETLNDRGIGLSTPDLLRNLLLRRAPDENSREQIISAWKTILSIDEEAPVDEFIRHYWVSHRGDVKARKLYREIKSRITEEHTDSLTLSRDLAESALIYRDIARARDDDPDIQRLLTGLRELGAKSLYPVALSAWSAVGDPGDDAKARAERKSKLTSLLKALLNVFVRYNVIAGRETTIMEATAYGVAAALRTTQDFDAATAALAELVPSADEFISRFSTASVGRIATARYLLRELEHAKRNTGEVAVEGPDKVHVEHIYPQDPAGERWPEHAQFVNRMGNLTLLSKRLNTSIKNADFQLKKPKAYEQSDILMTKELLAFDDWTTETVADRQSELSTWILGIWGFEGEAPPTTTLASAESPEGASGATATVPVPQEPPAATGDDAELNPEQLPETPNG
jgi:hypothetical protein